jgi:hypothetical protein
MSSQEQAGIAVISVPSAHAEKVREFANSLLEEQSPDVEGYAAIIGGIGGGGGISRSPIINSLSGTDCSLTGKPKNDFNCGDDD